MAITWRNVDVPQGLNLAAGQVQQSFKDVANSLKDVGQNFVDMKSNDAMAALEARLAQEQQLGNVDQMAAMDAAQLRGATSGWIDTKQARQQILGRQATLEQQGLSTAREALAAGDLATATQLEQQLRGRSSVDTSGLIKDIENTAFENYLAQSPEFAYESATTQEQKDRASRALFNRSVATKDFDKAGLYVQTPEQAQQLTLARNTDLINTRFPEYAKELQAAINNPNLDIGAGTKVINDITTKLYSGNYDVDTIAKLSAALTPLIQAVADKEMKAVTVAPEVQALVQEGIAKAPEAAGAILQPKFTDLEARAIQAGVPLELSEIYGNLNNITAVNEKVDLGTPDGISKLNDIVKSLDFKASGVPFFMRDFNASEVMERINRTGVDVSGISYGGLIAALSQVDFNRWFGGDAAENEKFALALQEEKGKTETRIKAAVDFNNERLKLTKEKEMLAASIAARLVDQSKDYTVRKVGTSGISGDLLLKFNPYGLGESIYRDQLQQAKAKLKETAPVPEPVDETVTPPTVNTEVESNKTELTTQPEARTTQEAEAAFIIQRGTERLKREKAKLDKLVEAQKQVGTSWLTGVSPARIKDAEREVERLERLLEKERNKIRN